MLKTDIPLDQAIALVRACQKLNCDTDEQLFAMVERRCTEAAILRNAIVPLMAQLIVAENGASLNGNVTIRKQTLPASVYDAALKAAQ